MNKLVFFVLNLLFVFTLYGQEESQTEKFNIFVKIILDQDPQEATFLISDLNHKIYSYSGSWLKVDSINQDYIFYAEIPYASNTFLSMLLIDKGSNEIDLHGIEVNNLSNRKYYFWDAADLNKEVDSLSQENQDLSENVTKLKTELASLKEDALLIGSFKKLAKLDTKVNFLSSHSEALQALNSFYIAELDKQFDTKISPLTQHRINRLQKAYEDLQSSFRDEEVYTAGNDEEYASEIDLLKQQIEILRKKRKDLESQLNYE